jgi:hypothetical protein
VQYLISAHCWWVSAQLHYHILQYWWWSIGDDDQWHYIHSMLLLLHILWYTHTYEYQAFIILLSKDDQWYHGEKRTAVLFINTIVIPHTDIDNWYYLYIGVEITSRLTYLSIIYDTYELYDMISHGMYPISYKIKTLIILWYAYISRLVQYYLSICAARLFT